MFKHIYSYCPDSRKVKNVLVYKTHSGITTDRGYRWVTTLCTLSSTSRTGSLETAVSTTCDDAGKVDAQMMSAQHSQQS